MINAEFMGITDLLIITASIIYIWNYSGFIFDLSRMLYERLNKDKTYKGQTIMKPFGCALCMVFWCVLGYALLIMKCSIIHSVGLGVLFSFVGMVIDLLIGRTLHLINKFK